MTARTVTFNNNFGIICRICLKEDGPMSSIYETENDYQPILAARITSIAQVQISPTDGLPVSICESCRHQVDNFYDFRLLVEISDRTLRSCLDGTHENQLITIDSTEDAKDLDYQEFLIENTTSDDSKDLFAVNAILVPSDNGTQVWRICGVEGENDEEKTDDGTAMERNENSAINNLEGVKESMTQKKQPVAIVKNVLEKETLYFPTTTTTTTTTNCQKSSTISDQLISIKILEDDNEEEVEEAPLPLNKYSCQLCLKSFKTLKTLKNHVKDHFLGGKERIQICDVKKKSVKFPRTKRSQYKSIEEQKNAGLEQENVNSLACQSCDQVFESAEARLSAREKKEKSSAGKGMETRNEKKHSCDECGTEFAQKSKLRYHKGTHTNASLTCMICNKNFRNSQSYNMHLKRHTLGTRFNCHECDKSYYSNSELARHAQLHTGTRQYPCHLCDMSFFSKPELNRHCKYHNGDKKFECKICFKTYYESGHLKVHQRVHTGEKPFPCTICEKAFITKSKLVRHFKIHERDRGTRNEETNINVQYRFVK